MDLSAEQWIRKKAFLTNWNEMYNVNLTNCFMVWLISISIPNHCYLTTVKNATVVAFLCWFEKYSKSKRKSTSYDLSINRLICSKWHSEMKQYKHHNVNIIAKHLNFTCSSASLNINKFDIHNSCLPEVKKFD